MEAGRTLWRIIVPVLVFLTAQLLLKHVLAGRLPCPGEAASALLLPTLLWAHRFGQTPHRTASVPLALVPAATLGIGVLCFLTQASVIQTVGSCLAGPMNEEILYRGYAFTRSKEAFGCKTAYLLSSLLFAAGHGSLSLFFPSLLAGFLLSAIYEQTNTLLIPMLVHIV